MLVFFLEVDPLIQSTGTVSTGQKRQREDRGGPVSKKAHVDNNNNSEG